MQNGDMKRFQYKGVALVHQEGLGFVFAPEGQEEGEEMDRLTLLDLFLNEEGRCFGGDDAFNHMVEGEAQALLEEVELTTNSSASSYGIPVLLWNGVALGPGDLDPRERSVLARAARRWGREDLLAWLEEGAEEQGGKRTA